MYANLGVVVNDADHSMMNHHENAIGDHHDNDELSSTTVMRETVTDMRVFVNEKVCE